jgi:hypothetical protein
MLVVVMRGIYDLPRLDGFSCHDVRTKFHNDLFRHSGDTQTHSMVISQAYFYFSKIRKLG